MTQHSVYPGSSIKTTRGRNNDVTEYSLVSAEGETLLKCARYYGFRNIQNLVRKLNPTRASRMPGAASRRLAGRGEGNDYAYVEVMACPGGCTNGGGQIKLEDVAGVIPETRGEMVDENIDKGSPQSQKEWAARVDEAYFSAESEDSEEAEVSEHGVDFDMNGYTGMKDYEDTADVNGRMNDDGSGGREVINGIDTSSVRNLLRHWSEVVDIPLSTLCYTTYRKVESDVGKSKKEVSKMGDSARIAAIAGASGGGW